MIECHLKIVTIWKHPLWTSLVNSGHWHQRGRMSEERRMTAYPHHLKNHLATCVFLCFCGMNHMAFPLSCWHLGLPGAQTCFSPDRSAESFPKRITLPRAMRYEFCIPRFGGYIRFPKIQRLPHLCPQSCHTVFPTSLWLQMLHMNNNLQIFWHISHLNMLRVLCTEVIST